MNVGPLIDVPGIDKVERHVADAREHGAELLLGARHELGGQFFTPTVLTGITDDMAMSNEETFGPVAGDQPLRHRGGRRAQGQRHAVRPVELLLQPRHGRIWRVSEALEYGILGINTGVVSTEVAPFGGVKESGIGREGSKYGIDEWLETKYLCMGGIEKAMIVEERTYHVFTGKLAEVVRLYAEEGTEVQQRHLGNLVGAFTVDIGDLSSIVQLWGYESLGERQERRAALQADEAWKASSSASPR